jgi:hypothetical protein
LSVRYWSLTTETEPFAVIVDDPDVTIDVGVRRIKPFLLMRPPTRTPT